jgi:hypothetical protein
MALFSGPMPFGLYEAGSNLEANGHCNRRFTLSCVSCQKTERYPLGMSRPSWDVLTRRPLVADRSDIIDPALAWHTQIKRVIMFQRRSLTPRLARNFDILFNLSLHLSKTTRSTTISCCPAKFLLGQPFLNIAKFPSCLTDSPPYTPISKTAPASHIYHPPSHTCHQNSEQAAFWNILLIL